jgi:hypothetical protein
MITIITASWGNEDKSAAIVNTTERGHMSVSERDTPEAWGDFLAWQAAGGQVRALEEGGAYKADHARTAAQAALRTLATVKLERLGITVDELRAVLE